MPVKLLAVLGMFFILERRDRMDTPRKLATSNQIKYANAIAKSLNIDILFREGAPFYDIHKFIQENEPVFKKNINNKLASERQIDYANAISNVCGLGKHFKNGTLAKDIYEFISENKSEYHRIIWRNDIINNANQYEQTIISKSTLLVACDQLYGKHGIYAFAGKENEIFYIGKSMDLSQRIISSYSERKNQAPICKILYYIENNVADMNILEILLICENKPLLNTESNTQDIPERFKSGIDIFRDFSELPVKSMEVCEHE